MTNIIDLDSPVEWKISAEAVEHHYRMLDTIGCLGVAPTAGFLRAAYSDEETAAMRYIESEAHRFGGVSRWDAVGNLFLEWPGTGPRFVEFGSHLDTVPNGGNFDGAAGVVAGLLAIEKILSTSPVRECGLRLRIWRGEESATFNSVYTGSLAAFGLLKPKALTHSFAGKTLEEAMRSQGIDVAIPREQKPTILQSEIDSIAAHIELHIEQGNLLEVREIDLGVVTSIRGPQRYRVTLTGEFDHSGATPMGTEYRKDCNLALGYMLVKLDELASAHLVSGADLVQTVGVINSFRDLNESTPEVYENAVPKVSGYAYFSFEIRSSSKAFCDAYFEESRALMDTVAAQFGVNVAVELLGRSDPLETVDSNIVEQLEGASSKLGISSIRMASGAGHDTAVVGARSTSGGPPVRVGMLFIPCRGGKSHCREEFATFEAIAKGASVLAVAGASLASK